MAAFYLDTQINFEKQEFSKIIRREKLCCSSFSNAWDLPFCLSYLPVCDLSPFARNFGDHDFDWMSYFDL
jgi:hypothetical protein